MDTIETKIPLTEENLKTFNAYSVIYRSNFLFHKAEADPSNYMVEGTDDFKVLSHKSEDYPMFGKRLASIDYESAQINQNADAALKIFTLYSNEGEMVLVERNQDGKSHVQTLEILKYDEEKYIFDIRHDPNIEFTSVQMDWLIQNFFSFQ